MMAAPLPLSATSEAVRAAALECARNGWPVFPLHGVVNGKCRCGHEHDQFHAGNHPCGGFSRNNASAKPATINGWIGQMPHMNFGVATGKELGESGTKLEVLICPAQIDTAAAIADLGLAGTTLIPAAVVDAGDGVKHIYLVVDIAVKLKIRSNPATPTKIAVDYVVGAGSTHYSGKQYTWAQPPQVLASPDEEIQAADAREMPSTVAGVVIDAAATIRGDEPHSRVEEAALPNGQSIEHKHVVNATSLASAALARMEQIKLIAEDYVAAGWSLCKITKGTKAPKDPGWPEKPLTIGQVGDHGLGLIHALSRTCAIDLDDLINARGWFAAKGIDLDDLLDSDDAVQIISGRKNRGKLLYQLPEGEALPATVKIKNPDGSMMIEFRCTGCQDVLPPTLHPDTGQAYQWAGNGDFKSLPQLPADVALLWKLGNAETNAAAAVQTAPGGAINDGGRNDALYKLGGDLARSGASKDAVTAALLVENQNRCTPPLAEHEVRAIGASASVNSNGAKVAATARLSQEDAAVVLVKAKAAVGAADSPTALDRTMVASAALPPVMASIATWSNRTSRTVQPAFTLCTSLAACSSILARDFVGAGGAHTNLYCVAVGPTACGKENAMNSVVNILNAYDPLRLAGAPASDSAVHEAMSRHPASTFVIDEIGEVLMSIFDQKAANHVARIGTAFMELYTKGGKAYRGKEYAQQTGASGRARKDVFSPNPSIFGATTATRLYDAINSSVINSGFLPRLLVFRAPDVIPAPNLDWEDIPMPDTVIAWSQAIKRRVANHRTASARMADLTGAGNDDYNPIQVPYSDAASLLFRQAQIDIVDRRNATTDPLESNMLSRLIENAGRVALTLALAADPMATEVGEDYFELAMTIVGNAVQTFMSDIRDNLFDSPHAKLEAKTLAAITLYYARNNGAPIGDGTLVDRCRPYGAVRPMERKAVIEGLQRQGKITVKAGRKTDTKLYSPSYESE